MKRLLLLVLTLAVLLSGCALPGSHEPTQEEVLSTYDSAAEVYDWFDRASLSYDLDDTRHSEGQTYYRVTDERTPTLTALKKLVDNAFSPDLAQKLLSDSRHQYREFNGALYTAGGSRESCPELVDTQKAAELIDTNHWKLTLTFWADSVKAQKEQAAPKGSDQDDAPVVIGYSQSQVDYEKTKDGWRFTSFCPSDGLDPGADTVFSFNSREVLSQDAYRSLSDWALCCYLVHSGESPLPAEELLSRCAANPGQAISALSSLYSDWQQPVLDKLGKAIAQNPQELSQALRDFIPSGMEEAVVGALKSYCEASHEDPTPQPPSNISYDRSVPILMYHHVLPDGSECNDMTVTVSRLEEDLQWLQKQGYTTILPRELASGQPLPEKPILITFDDGYRSNYELLYPLLKKYQAKAVISVIVKMQDVSASNFLSWDMCREMEDSGLVEIGSHTYQLHNLDGRGGSFTPGGTNGIERKPGESDMSFRARVLDDIQMSRDRIEEELGHPVTFFAYPFGVDEPDAQALIESLFPVTVMTFRGMADLSDGLRKLPRYTVTMKKPPSAYL
jgi:peptidoglycan/xylan/chitin deacetylase (PgdA/CDA1 family)